MTTKIISSVAEAIQFIETYQDSDLELPDVDFAGELAVFTAKIEGKNYNSTIPGELARGLWEFQEELYRAVAFALYDNDSIRKLTAEQRADFQLIFEVSQGSTDLMASLKAFFDKLGDGFGTMESRHKALTLVAIAIVLATAWGAAHIIDTQTDAKKEEIKAKIEITKIETVAKSEIDKEKEKTAQFQLFNQSMQHDPVIARFTKATEEGTKAIIKAASDATKIRVGQVTFDRADIQEVNQRAAKEHADAKILDGEFSIVRVEFRDDSTRIWLASKSNPEFPVTLIEDDFDADSLQKIWAAAKNRKLIKLIVNATFIRNQIRSAQIVNVI